MKWCFFRWGEETENIGCFNRNLIAGLRVRAAPRPTAGKSTPSPAYVVAVTTPPCVPAPSHHLVCPNPLSSPRALTLPSTPPRFVPTFIVLRRVPYPRHRRWNSDTPHSLARAQHAQHAPGAWFASTPTTHGSNTTSGHDNIWGSWSKY